MSKRNLVTALAAALESRPGPGKPPVIVSDVQQDSGDALLSALRNSATGRDQIMQRRLGAPPDRPA
jgi:hypothetical protein